MSTRATVRFATRKAGVSFNEHPKEWHAQFYVHFDGYPEGLGVDIAYSVTKNTKLAGWELEHVDHVHGVAGQKTVNAFSLVNHRIC